MLLLKPIRVFEVQKELKRIKEIKESGVVPLDWENGLKYLAKLHKKAESFNGIRNERFFWNTW